MSYLNNALSFSASLARLGFGIDIASGARNPKSASYCMTLRLVRFAARRERRSRTLASRLKSVRREWGVKDGKSYDRQAER
jgi:hypothetical protein